jgi:cold shock CspA family protein
LFPGSYGFLEYVKQESDEQGRTQWIGLEGSKPVFFSFNHMRKKKDTNIPETPIESLNIGDIVGFVIGMNNKGPCATDVTMIQRAPALEENGQPEIIDLVRDAIHVCANENGWALMSSVGGRLSVLHPNYMDLLLQHGYDQLAVLIRRYPAIFEYSHDGIGTNHRAACVRIR